MDKNRSKATPPELRQPTENAVGPMPTPDPVIKRQPQSKTGWSRPGKIILSRRFCRLRLGPPAWADNRELCAEITPATQTAGRRYICNGPADSQEGENPGCAVSPTLLPQSATGNYPHVPAGLSGFASHPKQDGLETGSPDIAIMNNHEQMRT